MTTPSLPPHITLVRANNPGPMTLDGTNSYVIDGGSRLLVVDPGPASPEHLHALVEHAAGRPLEVLITHWHLDHTAGLHAFAGVVAPERVIAASPAFANGYEPITKRTQLECGSLAVDVIPTPGHTHDSISAIVATSGQPAALIAGDTILGRGSSVIAAPDGDVAAYLTSLGTLIAALTEIQALLLPGHGPAGAAALAAAQQYASHRAQRIAQVSAAFTDGARTTAELRERVYPDLAPELHRAADASLAAHLDYVLDHA